MAGLVYFAMLAVLPPRWRYVAAGVLVVAAAILLVNRGIWAQPWMHYGARTVVGAAMAAMLLLAGFAEWRRRRPALVADARGTAPAVLAALGPAALVLVMSAAMVWHTLWYARWLHDFDLQSSVSGGPVALEDAALIPELTAVYGWPWTNPVLSTVLHEDGDTTILSPGERPESNSGVPAPIPERFDTAVPVPY